jgi:hypothetical protein
MLGVEGMGTDPRQVRFIGAVTPICSGLWFLRRHGDASKRDGVRGGDVVASCTTYLL